MLEKLCLVNFSKFNNKKVNHQKTENITVSVLKIAQRNFFGFLVIYIC